MNYTEIKFLNIICRINISDDLNTQNKSITIDDLSITSEKEDSRKNIEKVY